MGLSRITNNGWPKCRLIWYHKTKLPINRLSCKSLQDIDVDDGTPRRLLLPDFNFSHGMANRCRSILLDSLNMKVMSDLKFEAHRIVGMGLMKIVRGTTISKKLWNEPLSRYLACSLVIPPVNTGVSTPISMVNNIRVVDDFIKSHTYTTSLLEATCI